MQGVRRKKGNCHKADWIGFSSEASLSALADTQAEYAPRETANLTSHFISTPRYGCLSPRIK